MTASKIPKLNLFFGWHDAHPTVLGTLLIRELGPEMLDWESDVLRSSIKDVFRANSIAALNWQKIQAFRAILQATSVWYEWEIFEKIILALNNVMPTPASVQKCSVAQLWNGVNIINEIRGGETWSEDIHKYVAACALDQGITWLPEPLQDALPYIERPYFRCPTCDHVVDLDSESMKCIVSYDTEFPFNEEGTPTNCPLLQEDWVRLVVKRVNSDPVKNRFYLMKDQAELSFSDTDFVAVQAAKLVVAYRYAGMRTTQMAEQLEALS